MSVGRKKPVPIVVRDYTAADREGILVLWRTVFEENFSYLEDSPTEEDFRFHFETVVRNRHRIWVAAEGSAVIGFVTAKDDSIRNLFIDRRYQRRGIGTALLQTALRHNPAICQISTLASNIAARQFYEKNGFVLSGTESHSFPGHQTSIYRRPSL